MNALSKILVSFGLALGVATVHAEVVNVETDYPANVMPAAHASAGPVQSPELFLIQSNEGAAVLNAAIVDSSVDPELIRAEAGEDRPFDIGYFA